LNEDPYGVVQKDIAKILEGFVRFLQVLESLEKEFGMLAREKEDKFGKEDGERWRQVERDNLGVVKDGQFTLLLFRFEFHVCRDGS